MRWGRKVSAKGRALDENRHDSDEAPRILSNIISKAGGGILPPGGSSGLMGGYKGCGLGVIAELFTGILAGTAAAPFPREIF